MSKLSKIIMVVGLVILLVGAYQTTTYMDAASRADSAGQFESIGILLGWMMNSYQLLILNIFLTGIAVLTSGYAIHRQGGPA